MFGEEDNPSNTSSVTLGYTKDELWIEFRGEISRFPTDIQLDKCVKTYLADRNWVYTEGNGCGTGMVNRLFLRFIHATVDIDFTPICNLHDIGYSLAPDNNVCAKSYRHKMYVDMAFEYNILTFAKMHGKEGRGIRTLAFCYMMAVRLLGASHYWQGIQKKDRL